jgi:hypothetical protein
MTEFSAPTGADLRLSGTRLLRCCAMSGPITVTDACRRDMARDLLADLRRLTRLPTTKPSCAMRFPPRAEACPKSMVSASSPPKILGIVGDIT